MIFQIKKATLSDANAVAQLFDAYRVFYKKASDIALAQEFISERLENEQSVIFSCISDDNQYLGFVQLYPIFSSVSAKRSWVLNDLFVAAEHRGLGISKLLMNAAKQLAVETDANGIALETSPDNKTAKALYESLGYQQQDEYLHYFLAV